MCKNDDDGDKVPVIISGSQTAIDKAKSLIQELIEEADMYRKPLPPPRGDNGKDIKS